MKSVIIRTFFILKVHLLKGTLPFHYKRICFNKRKWFDKFEQ